MTTYAKYADMYRQRVARSQDHRLELSQRISPVRNSAANVTRVVNGASAQQSQFQAHTLPSPRSSNGAFPKNQRGKGSAAAAAGIPEIPAHLKMTNDRAAYMTFLEVQLERVTQACTNALSFQEKVEGLQVQCNAQDEKMQNVSRLVKLLQSFSEAQEEDLSTLRQRVQNVGQRCEELAQLHSRHGAGLLRPQDSVAESAGGFGLVETKHGSSMSPTRRSANKRSFSKSKSPANRSERKTQGTIGERVTQLESLVQNMNSQTNNFNSNLLQSNSFGTLEQPQKAPGLAQLKEDLMNFAQEVDRQMRDVEARIVNNLSQHFEELNVSTNSKIDEALLLLDQKVSKLQHMTSPAFSRPNLIESTQIVEDGRINPAKMEEALNDWLSRVEDQVNQIEEKVDTRAAQVDLKSLEHRVLDMHEEREIRFGQLEQYCQRMCEQGNNHYNEMKEVSLDWEDRFLQIQRQIEVTVDEQTRSIVPHEEGRASLLRSGLTSHVEGSDLTHLRTVEKRLARRLGDGVDRLGNIMKDMTRAQRKLENRTSALEHKVFGKRKNSNSAAEAAKKKAGARVPAQIPENSFALVGSVGVGNISARRGSAIVKSATKSSAKALLNQTAIASPKAKPATTRRRSQKTFSPPVKDASQGPEKRSLSNKHKRSRSRSSMRPRSSNGMQIMENERPSSVSARQPRPNGSLNNFRTSFEQRLLQENGQNDGEVSPREILRRARDRSIRELSHSLNESRSRSPHSNRLQNLVELEQASPHHHHRLSSSVNKIDGSGPSLPHQNVSILNGPVAGQKNIVASNTISSEMDQFQQRLNSGREYTSLPQNDLSRTSDRYAKRNRADDSAITTENKKSSTKKAAKAQRRASRSASRERSREHAYTLQELERRERSLKRKISVKNDEVGQKRASSSASRNKAARQFKTQQPASSKERSLSQRTFQRMNAIGHNTLLAAQKGTNVGPVPQSAMLSHNPSYQQLSSQQRANMRRADRSGTERGQISPNRAQGPLKTTKSVSANVTQEIKTRKRSESARRSGSRGRSRSANQYTETSAERPRPAMGVAKSFRANQTAAHQIFHQPLEYQTHSQSNLEAATHNTISRRNSNHVQSIENSIGQRKKGSAARKRSISVDRSREEKKSVELAGKKKSATALGAKQGTPVSSKKAFSKADSTVGAAASKTAKQKLKNLQNKKSNQRLARLEKMYQELTEIEAKTAAGII